MVKNIERKLAAIVFTDLVNFSLLSSEDEIKALELLEKQREIVSLLLDEFNGTLHKETGDGLLISFSNVSNAVKFSINLQKQSKSIKNLNLRIGIHEGEVIFKENDILGDDVNLTSRIEPFASEGGIAISGKVQQNLLSQPEFKTKYIGKPKLKGIAQNVEIYCISSHGMRLTDVSKVTAKLEKEEKSNINIYSITGSILTILGISFWFFFSLSDIALTNFSFNKKIPSIAIIPFENKGSKEDDFYAYSISSEIKSNISESGLINVASTNDIQNIEYSKHNNQELSEKLDYRYICQGTLWKKDNIFLVSIEIFDSNYSKLILSKKWQNTWDELPNINNLMTESILTSLKIEKQNQLKKYKTDNSKAYEYFLRGKYIFDNRTNFEDIQIARDLLVKATDIDNNLLDAKTLLAWSYYETNNYEKGLALYKEILKQAEMLENKSSIAICLNGLATYESYVNFDYILAIDYSTKALQIFIENNNKKWECMMLTNISINYNEYEQYDSALVYAKKAYEIAESLVNIEQLAYSQLTLGSTYYNLNNFKKAEYFYLRGIDSHKKSNLKSNFAKISEYLGNYYFEIEDYDNAIIEYTNAVNSYKKLRKLDDYYFHIRRIGDCYFYKENVEESLKYYMEALDNYIIENDKKEICTTNIYIGDTYYSLTTDYKSALKHYMDANFMAVQINQIEDIVFTEMMMGLVYMDLYDSISIDNLNKALYHFNEALNKSNNVVDKKYKTEILEYIEIVKTKITSKK